MCRESMYGKAKIPLSVIYSDTDTHSEIVTVWTQCKGSSVLKFLPVGAWHAESPLLLDLLASLHAVSEGVTHQYSHIHTESITQGHSPLLATGGFFMLPSPESITCLPLWASWGAASTLTNWWNTNSRELRDVWETQREFKEGQGERNLPSGKVIHCVTYT